MGCLFGAHLTPHADVVLVGRWPAQLQALRAAPLQITDPEGRITHVWLRVTDDLAEVGRAEVALVLTKAGGTARAAQDMARVLAVDGLAVTLQNGIGNLEILAAAVGPDRVTLGVTMQGASTGGQPGTLRLGGAGPTYLAVNPSVWAPVRELSALFNRAGLPTQVVDDVSALVWEKLAVNAGINPLTALLQVPNGALVESDWARRIMAEAAREVAAVAVARGITLPFVDAGARAAEVARLTAHNRSSMLQDMLRGAPTEIEVICGAVIRIGENRGVATPVNRLLYMMVKAREETAESRDEAQL